MEVSVMQKAFLRVYSKGMAKLSHLLKHLNIKELETYILAYISTNTQS